MLCKVKTCKIRKTDVDLSFIYFLVKLFWNWIFLRTGNNKQILKTTFTQGTKIIPLTETKN